jgi:two-component system, NarL family, nitrate/nitrite response regulator NarL
MIRSESLLTARALRVLIVADVRLYREGLAASVAGRRHAMIVATSGSRADALAQIHQSRADVIVVDMATRDSLELIADLRRESADAKILAFAVEDVTSDILDCAAAGAAGYVTVDASIDELVTAIERIAREELVCSPRMTAQLFGHVAHGTDRRMRGVQSRTLTNRERQVLTFIQHGDSNKEIAQKLNIAEPTVKNHVHNLLEKLEVTSRAQAAARATFPTRRRSVGSWKHDTRETG